MKKNYLQFKTDIMKIKLLLFVIAILITDIVILSWYIKVDERNKIDLPEEFNTHVISHDSLYPTHMDVYYDSIHNQYIFGYNNK